MKLNNVIKQMALDAVRQSQPTAITYGTVTSTSPLVIETDQKLIIPKGFLALSRNVTDYKTEIEIGGSRQEATIYNSLQVGEKVIMIREPGGQRYFVMCREGEINDTN